MELMKYEVSNGIQCGLKGESYLFGERGKSKSEVADLLEIGIANLYRWLKKKGNGESLEAGKNGSFVRKIDPEVLNGYVKKHPASRNETKSRIWNKFNLV